MSDQPADIRTAVACGCKGIGVLTCAGRSEDFQPFQGNGVVVVPSIADVLDLADVL